MPRYQVNKIVRDKILELMEAEGQMPKYRVLKGKDLQQTLLTKLKEEADEALSVIDDDEKLIIELADIKEAFETFAKARGIDLDLVQKAQTTKRDTKGGFAKGYFLEKLKLESSDHWVQYYGDRPLQYQEIFRASSDEHGEQFDVPHIEPDLYQHYKGKYYEVVGVARHTENPEYFVVYKSLYRQGKEPTIWVRPYDMFIESVEVDGQWRPRFRRMGQ
jgi:predicted house-cleaning noncanonical NTP pyrophosphatase (MazG superfamily)